ncbi:serine/threonine-protein kinase MARK2-like [Mangifera indica]|uniref:serine/threonine-protein kinase MARK2-like n=1 Tax=Mangifera indica TaxID=29780 RepID=UPI001CFB2F40|nr:serine/threonine-protein kinase MARK2-like [Mangifera indica]
MEQFRQVGEVIGSLNALMVLKEDIRINKRQCCLLLDMFNLAFSTIAEGIKLFLKSEEKNTKWRALEQPLRELHKVIKEGELYVRQCLDDKDWWGKAITLHQNRDCVEFHIHNLLCYFPAVIEAIEAAGEISGLDPDEMQRRRVALARKYDREWNDPKLFHLKFGKEYLIPREICSRFESSWKEDRWLLIEELKQKRRLGSVVLTKNEQRLVDMLLKKLDEPEDCKGQLFPTSTLLGGKDYQVRRRIGGGGQYKEIIWLGNGFAIRQFYGEIDESLNSEIANLLSISHPNIVQYLCGFYDEEKKEIVLVMELLSKDLCLYMRETFGSKRRSSFSLPIVVDLMLQIARGMEFLHSQRIYHGELNPSKIFLKPRISTEGYFHVKVSGFGLPSVKSYASQRSVPPPLSNQHVADPCIWFAPEVLAEQEEGGTLIYKYSEKADVYSFGMLCFELLTGKVPFEDGHLQGDKMVRNIRAGERPLFPSGYPKYIVNLTKKCWHPTPSQRPSFSSICRILRYIKKSLVMNPEHAQSEFQSPLADYYDIEAGFLRKFVLERSYDEISITQIPFQLFSYRISEKEKAILNNKDTHLELGSDAVSICKDRCASVDAIMLANEMASDVKSVCFDMRSVYTEIPGKNVSQFDTRSVHSEAPRKKISSSEFRPFSPEFPSKNASRWIASRALANNFPSPDTKSVDSKTTEKTVSGPETKSGTFNAQDKKISSSDTKSACSRKMENQVKVVKKATYIKVKKSAGTGVPKAQPARPNVKAQTQKESPAETQSPKPSPMQSPRSTTSTTTPRSTTSLTKKWSPRSPFIAGGCSFKIGQEIKSPLSTRTWRSLANSSKSSTA